MFIEIDDIRYKFRPSPFGTCHNLMAYKGSALLHLANIWQFTYDYRTGGTGDGMWYIDPRGFTAPQPHATLNEARDAAIAAHQETLTNSH
jgi:hypothetical protein